MRKLVGISVPFIVVLTLATGCSSGANEPVDTLDEPPITYTTDEDGLEIGDTGEIQDEKEADEEAEEEGEAEEGEDEVSPDAAQESRNLRELYLIDSDGMVVPQTLTLPKTESLMKQSLEYLVVEGPLQELLPSGFRGVIPAGTEVEVNHLKEDKLAIANFSAEFGDYNPDDEKRIFEAITWTLTQFPEVEEVKIEIDGIELDKMPQNETPIVGNLTRADGINLDSSGVVDFTNSEDLTLYFLSSYENQSYYVPVTRRIENVDNAIASAVDELINGPAAMMTNLTGLSPEIQLLEDPELVDGEVVLNFNEAIQAAAGEEMVIPQTVLESLALTLTEQMGIEKVSIQVNGEAGVQSESGQEVEEVTRPTMLNVHPL